jgi:hypothetical protein
VSEQTDIETVEEEVARAMKEWEDFSEAASKCCGDPGDCNEPCS